MPIEPGQAPPQNGPKDLNFYWQDGIFDAVDQNGYHYELAVNDVSKGPKQTAPPADQPKPEPPPEGGNEGGSNAG
jgi:hypothetical protein